MSCTPVQREEAVAPYDLVVFGGGVSALWLTLLAAQRNLHVCLIVDRGLGGHASSGNQGWLHSGALYAAYESPSLVASCQAGSREVEKLADENGLSFTAAHGACLYGVDSLKRRDKILRILADAGVPADPVQARDVERLTPLASNESHYVISSDFPVDTAAVLRALWTGAQRRGAQVVDAGDLAKTSCVRGGGAWSIRIATGQRLRARAIVIALGSTTPAFAARIGHPEVQAVARTLSRVLVVHVPVPPVIVISLRRTGPHAVPVITGGTSPRFTVCLPFDNNPLGGRLESADVTDVARLLVRCPELLQPLRSLLDQREEGIPLGLYWCEKVQGIEDLPGTPASRAPRVQRLAPDCCCLYAGKFTTAPLAARLCLEQLVGDGLVPNGPVGPAGTPDVPMRHVSIEPRDALAPPDFVLRIGARNRSLTVEPIE